jgi:dATP pyrophosphohydrolase
MRLPVQVLVYPVAHSAGGPRVLLLKRVVRLGAFWQGVTGAPLGDESLQRAASRELQEETGFQAAPVDLGFSYSFSTPKEYRNLYSRGVAEITEYAFLAEVPKESPTLSAEHDDWQWCTFPEARAMLKWTGNKRALDRAEEYLREVPGA